MLFSSAPRRWIAWAVLVFALHFAWEMAQANWFENMPEKVKVKC